MAARKTSGRKSGARKSSARKSGAGRTSARKTSSRKTSSRKTGARKTSARKTSSRSSGGRKYGPKASEKVEKVMHERKRGTLRSGGSGKKVTSRKQAIAIGLSEARRAGAKVPSRRSSRKK
jgi:hypothetical protein